MQWAMQTTEVISTLSDTTRQLEVDRAAQQAARRRAEGDAAGRERAAQASGAALEAICSELCAIQVSAVRSYVYRPTAQQHWKPRVTVACVGMTARWLCHAWLADMLCARCYAQDELRRQAGAAAFHQKFAANLSLLLENARGALAELHLTVTSLLACQRHNIVRSSAAAVGRHPSFPDSGGDAAAAKAAEQSAKCALARAAACHGNLPLGRVRQSRIVQTAYCEMWSLAAGPWGRNDVRREVYDVMTGRTPPDSSLRALASACHAASLHTGQCSSGDPTPGEIRTGFAPARSMTGSQSHGAAAAGHAVAAAADFRLRKPPPAAATLRTVQTIYAAKTAADAAARTAMKQPVPLYALHLHIPFVSIGSLWCCFLGRTWFICLSCADEVDS